MPDLVEIVSEGMPHIVLLLRFCHWDVDLLGLSDYEPAIIALKLFLVKIY